jgi:urease accessory protein
LLLLDSRSPTGGHNHSLGMESAIDAGLVRDLGGVAAFCAGRLRTSGRVSASFAAAACEAYAGPAPDWTGVNAEFDARTPSEALRTASRQLGAGLRRMASAMLPEIDLPHGHHPVVLGAAVAAAGGHPAFAARAAALATITAPASAAIRLLGLVAS